MYHYKLEFYWWYSLHFPVRYCAAQSCTAYFTPFEKPHTIKQFIQTIQRFFSNNSPYDLACNYLHIYLYFLVLLRTALWGLYPIALTATQSWPDGSRGMSHGLQLAVITHLWFVGLNLGWDCLNRHWLRIHFTSGNFHRFQRPLITFCTALTAGTFLPLALCSETGKESTRCSFVSWCWKLLQLKLPTQ